ncbi:WxL domain-containing protein [Lapidilactobacillus luobeiensis]|uniref:WxL domain-containing protein n=1 Tax=Lapidilactobacillus luobeiensis TaxID=2950371 RepID=UPI0021C3C40D|nr:WxL domain-containing protein [Lapidilactobacillus luobeiensis]
MKKSMSLLAVTLLAASTFALSTTTTKAATDDLNNESTANFTVSAKEDPDNPDPEDPDSGKLVLKSVPTFSAGTFVVSKVYNGFTNETLETSNNLEVADNRIKGSDWNLDLNMGSFQDESSNRLIGATLAFTAQHDLFGEKAVSVTDDGTDTVLNNAAVQHGNFILAINNPTLSMNANGSAIVADNSHYAASLDWTLSSGAPAAEEL